MIEHIVMCHRSAASVCGAARSPLKARDGSTITYPDAAAAFADAKLLNDSASARVWYSATTRPVEGGTKP